MIPTIQDLDFRDKRVIVRVDYNVPLTEAGDIVDDTRIKASLPTLEALFERGARQLVLLTHIGRPDGKRVPHLSTDKVALRLMQHLGKTVQKVDDCVDVELPETPVVMLENVRFHEEEEANDAEFARKLAQNGELFVNDAFGTAHREHASTVGVTKHVKGCVGLLIQKELHYLDIHRIEKPVVTILGGAKLETKLPLLQRMLPNVDKLLVGGAMIFTFYKARGWEVGKSLLDEKNMTMAQMLTNNDKVVLPTDVVVAPSPKDGDRAKVVPAQGIPADMIGLDIGPESVEHFKHVLSGAKTVVWNGPLGFVEEKPFGEATIAIMEHLAELTKGGVITIVGGGDSIAMVERHDLDEKFTHVSTGGGASMKLMEGKKLPALQALER
ncbi:phosphoglycerate kinase [Candidatus Woesearchaeota archaeon]|nr:phosphoglycerate kinase [Candidatus Woesearchaeota archaeon]